MIGTRASDGGLNEKWMEMCDRDGVKCWDIMMMQM